MTLNRQLEFDLACWQNHSAQCKDLITKLLLKSPKERISLENALKHEWFDDVRDSYSALYNHKTN